MVKKEKTNKNKTLSALRNPEIQKRILFTLLILLVYRIGSAIPVPGVDRAALTEGLKDNSVFSIMNMLGGGALEHMSVFALGVSPYITASIIIELLSNDVIPALNELREQGAKGRARLGEITKYLGLVLAILQALSITYGFNKQYGIMTDTSFANYAFVVTVLTAGTEIMCWLGDRITAYGVGNGISIIILAGIVANIPEQFAEAWSIFGSADTMFLHAVKFILYLALYSAIIVAVVFVENSERRVPVQYSRATSAYGGTNMSYIPFKINSSSVIPVIFAASVLTAPLIVTSFFSTSAYQKLNSIFSMSKPVGLIIYAVLVFFFTYFYTELQIDTDTLSDNLAEGQAFIPGIRPGSETKGYLHNVLMRVTTFGAIGLTILAVIPYLLPMLITGMPSSMGLGGTSMILVVGICTETLAQIRGINTAKGNQYSGYFGKAEPKF